MLTPKHRTAAGMARSFFFALEAIAGATPKIAGNSLEPKKGGCQYRQPPF